MSSESSSNDDIIKNLTKDFEDSSQDLDAAEPELQNRGDSDFELLKQQEKSLSGEEKEVKRQEAISMKNKGNEEFRNGNYLESIQIYTKALSFCPLQFSKDRAILFSNRAASKIKLEHKESAIEDCTKALKLDDTYVRVLLRRAKLYEESDKLEESLDDFKKILDLDPGNKDALNGSYRLPPLISERNEKLKDEMMGKLKDLGNMILKPFGLSTNNFKMQQDPNSGGYSINFQQNPSS